MPPHKNSEHWILSLAVVFLIAGSWVGNFFKFTLFFNVDFLFGSIFTVLLLIWFKKPWGILSGVVAGSCTYLLWNHPYAMLILIGEAVFIRLNLFRKTKNIVLLDTVYWAMIGMPAVWVFYHLVMGMDQETVFLIMLKQGTNGVFNALIATLISFGVSRFFQPQKVQRLQEAFSFQNLLFVILTAFVLFPTLAGLAASGRYELSETEEHVSQTLDQTSLAMVEVLNSWVNNDLETLQALSEFVARQDDLAGGEIKHLLGTVRRSNSSFIRLGVCNRNAVSLVMDPPINQGRSAVGFDYSDRPYFQALKKTLQPQVSEIIISKVDRVTPTVVMAYPVIQGSIWRGYLMAAINLQEVSQKMQNIIKHWGAAITVLDSRGSVILSSLKEHPPGQNFHGRERGVIQKSDRGLEILTDSVGANISVMQQWKNSRYIKSRRIAYPVSWTVLVELPVEPYMHRMFNVLVKRMFFLMFMIMATVAISHVLSRKMVSSISRLQDITTDLPEKIAQGGRIAWPESPIHEVYSLVTNFRSMAETLEHQYQALKSAYEEVSRAKTEADAANHAKSEFLAVMSHEIRTPMNAILGMTEITLQENLDDGVREQMQTVRNSGLHLLDLINAVLDFSKIEAGRLDAEMVDFDLMDLLSGLKRTMDPPARSKGLSLEFDLPEDLPSVVRGDPVRLRQILVNLIGNAIKFTLQGGVRLTIGFEQARQDQDRAPEAEPFFRIDFSIQDTGVGIPEDQLEHIFHEFSQADTSIARKFGGSGLGLSISRRLVDLLGGRLEVRSRVGQGSTFSFSLPLAEGDPRNLDVSETSETFWDPEAGRTAAILLAEDNEINTRVALLALGRLGYEVTPVATGFQVLQALSVQGFDLVLMDLEMPDLDGIQTTRQIRQGQAGSANSRIPIIAMTAHAFSSYRKKCLEAGMDDYVSKPLKFSRLHKIIQHHLGRETEGSGVDLASPSVLRSSLLDWKSALDHLDGDENLLQELCALFIEDFERKIRLIMEALEKDEPGTIVPLAHSLKGSAGTIGANSCRILAETMEKAVRQEDLSQVRQAALALNDEFFRLKEFILAGLPPK